MFKMEPFQRVIQEVARERGRQDEKWGESHDAKHSLQDWLNIMRDELGEAQNANSQEECLIELIHLTAVTVAAIQHWGTPHV